MENKQIKNMRIQLKFSSHCEVESIVNKHYEPQMIQVFFQFFF